MTNKSFGVIIRKAIGGYPCFKELPTQNLIHLVVQFLVH